jgi:hypothetical protein
MTRTTLGILIALPFAASLAWSIGGASGFGVFLGFTVGAGVSVLGVSWQGIALRRRPARALQANVESFLATLFLLLGSALAIRAFEPLASRVDWRTYLVAFGAAVAVIPPLGLIELTRGARRTKAL